MVVIGARLEHKCNIKKIDFVTDKDLKKTLTTYGPSVAIDFCRADARNHSRNKVWTGKKYLDQKI